MCFFIFWLTINQNGIEKRQDEKGIKYRKKCIFKKGKFGERNTGWSRGGGFSR